MTTIHPNMLNEVMTCKKSLNENLEVGMGVTEFVGSDRYALVLCAITSPREVKVCHISWEDAKRFVRDSDGIDRLPVDVLLPYIKDYNGWLTYTKRKNGRWMPKGQGMWGTCSIHIGQAENYRDPSF